MMKLAKTRFVVIGDGAQSSKGAGRSYKVISAASSDSGMPSALAALRADTCPFSSARCKSRTNAKENKRGSSSSTSVCFY